MSLPAGFRPLEFDVRPRRSAIERAALRHLAVHHRIVRQLDRRLRGRPRRALLERVLLPQSYSALNRRDLDTLARLYFTEDIRMRFVGDRILGFRSEFSGREEVVAAYGEWMDEWGVMERRPVAYLERGDVLIVLTRQRGRGRGSGIAIDDEIGQVYRVRDGLAAEYIEYRSWAEAVAYEG